MTQVQPLTEAQKGAQQLKRALVMLSFFMLLLLVIAALVGLGVPRGESGTACWAGTNSVTQYNVICLTQEVPKWVFKALLAVPFIAVVVQLVCRINAYISATRLIADMNTADGNDSSAILLWSSVITIGIIFMRTPLLALNGAGILEFAVNLTIRFVVTMMFALVVDVASLRALCNVRSFEQFVKLIQIANTNSAAYTVGGGMIFAALFVI